MQTLLQHIHTICAGAIQGALPELDFNDELVMVTPSTKPEFGDYQCNSALRLAKMLGEKPRDIATKIAAQLEQRTEFSKIEIAGPGFINLSISDAMLNSDLHDMLIDSHLGVRGSAATETVVVDFSSPNIAKEMHVGHLRSTIIGDSIARMLEFLGNNVVRINHLGDWGTAFGMLITYLKDQHPQVLDGSEATDLSHLVAWYKAAKKQFDEDADFKTRSRLQVVALQGGEADALRAWEIICQISRQAFQEIYDLLDIKITERGESSYNDRLAGIVEDLEQQKLITVSDGAKCVFLDGFTSRGDKPLPFIVQKSDGGYNYSTTDMAAIRQRIDDDKATRLIYVTDAGQNLHFRMVFATAQLAGYLNPKAVQTQHAGFGLVLGPDGKKFKTRSGETERLIDLLNEAVKRAKAILVEREIDLSEEQIDHAAKVLGIGAVKYADLSSNRVGDYSFSYDKMLRFDGNTAAFILYSYVRIQSIKRKLGDSVNPAHTAFAIQHPSEHALAISLRRFPEVLLAASSELLPNRLTDYLFELAQKFNAFFRDCRVEGSDEQNARVLLCELTAKTLKTGLELLGIQTLDKM